MSNTRLNPLIRWYYKRSLKIANAARSARDWQTAHKNYVVALKAFPNAAPIWVQCGHAAKEMGEFAAAEKAYRTANRLAPGDVDLQIQLGHLFKETGRHAEALVHYKSALAAGATDVHAIDYVFSSTVAEADAASENGWVERSIALYREASNTRADFGVFLHLGARLTELGDFDAARQAYLSALAQRPDDPEALLRIEGLASPSDQRETAPVAKPEPQSVAPRVVPDPARPEDASPQTPASTKELAPLALGPDDETLSEHAAIICERLRRSLMHRRA